MATDTGRHGLRGASLAVAVAVAATCLAAAPSGATTLRGRGYCDYELSNWATSAYVYGRSESDWCSTISDVRVGNTALGNGRWIVDDEISEARYYRSSTIPQGTRWYSDHRLVQNRANVFWFKCTRLWTLGTVQDLSACNDSANPHRNGQIWSAGSSRPARMLPGQRMIAANGYSLVMQGDGNLVEYGPGGRVMWASGTQGFDGAHVDMQHDGNLVVYTADGRPICSTRTVRPSSTYSLAVQEDGNLVIYGPSGPIWAAFSGGRCYR